MPNPTMQDYCDQHGTTEFVLEQGKYRRCKKCRNARIVDQRRKTKLKLIDIFGGKCALCGYSRCTRSLEFHHLDPSAKKFGISAGGATRAFKQCLAEAKKCILVCSNCHGEIEDGLIDLRKLTG